MAGGMAGGTAGGMAGGIAGGMAGGIAGGCGASAGGCGGSGGEGGACPRHKLKMLSIAASHATPVMETWLRIADVNVTTRSSQPARIPILVMLASAAGNGRHLSFIGILLCPGV